jgi:hypothetical protein
VFYIEERLAECETSFSSAPKNRIPVIQIYKLISLAIEFIKMVNAALNIAQNLQNQPGLFRKVCMREAVFFLRN